MTRGATRVKTLVKNSECRNSGVIGTNRLTCTSIDGVLSASASRPPARVARDAASRRLRGVVVSTRKRRPPGSRLFHGELRHFDPLRRRRPQQYDALPRARLNFRCSSPELAARLAARLATRLASRLAECSLLRRRGGRHVQTHRGVGAERLAPPRGVVGDRVADACRARGAPDK